jgi:hypothetical protein
MDYVAGQGDGQRRSLATQTAKLAQLEEERMKLMGAYYGGAIPIEVLKRGAVQD